MDNDGEVFAQDERVRDDTVYRMVISYNPGLCEYHVEGLTVPVWLALGMLEYAQTLVRRRDAEKVMAAAIQGARVLGVSGRVR